MTAKGLWEVFKEMFPDIAEECTKFSMNAPGQIIITRYGKRGLRHLIFTFRDFGDWSLESVR